MHTQWGLRAGAKLVYIVGLTWLAASHALAADCNNNGVEDALDIAGGTSQDCDLNGVPDECQPDTDNDGTIDACDDCGIQLTDNNADEQFSVRQSVTSQGFVLWFDNQDDIYVYDGNVQLLQARVENNVDLEGVANFVFALGSGAGPGLVLGAWRRGTDFAYIWANDNQGVRPVNYTNPYDPNRAMNPEDVAISDGCIFMIFQAPDPNTNTLPKHVYKLDPATGDALLLTGDFLDDVQTGGTGAEPTTLVTSDCKAAWSWCSESNGGACTAELDLHYFDGTTTSVLDTNAVPLAFAGGRLIYSKPVNGIQQLFLYDSNPPIIDRLQLTSFEAADKQMIYAQTDGRHVAILVADANGQDPEIILLDDKPLSGPANQPADAPPSNIRPFQMNRGQLMWTAQDTSVVYFNGREFSTVCSEGWLADGFLAQLRRDANTGADLEVYIAVLSPPDDGEQPVPPMLVEAETTANGEVTVSWSRVLGATLYNVYFATETGVDASNYQGLSGGGTSAGVSESPAVITGLQPDQIYYFVVTSVEGTSEGPASVEVTANPCLDPAADGDGDGTPDCADECPDDPDKTEPGVCGCGVPDTDSDGDGVPDCQDDCPDDPDKTEPGQCGCGVPDTDSDADGVPDCLDDCPNDPSKTAPGVCGCGVADVDADGDGVIDCEQTGGDEPEPPDDDQTGCAPGLCGPGVVPLLPVLMLGMGLIRRSARRSRGRGQY